MELCFELEMAPLSHCIYFISNSTGKDIFYAECYHKSLSLNRRRETLLHPMWHIRALSCPQQNRALIFLCLTISSLLTSRVIHTVQSVEHTGCWNFDSLGKIYWYSNNTLLKREKKMVILNHRKFISSTYTEKSVKWLVRGKYVSQGMNLTSEFFQFCPHTKKTNH